MYYNKKLFLTLIYSLYILTNTNSDTKDLILNNKKDIKLKSS
jgi:hypothetical protein